jgi:hypothetical protein
MLLGFDMHAQVGPHGVKTHWFGDHPGNTSPSVYDSMLPWFDTLVAPLEEARRRSHQRDAAQPDPLFPPALDRGGAERAAGAGAA